MKRVLSVLKWVAIVAVALVLVLLVTGLVLHEARPGQGETGEQADVLARRMQSAVERDAWESTGAVRFDFDHRQQHLWDRTRGLSRVRWSDGSMEVLHRLDRREGRAWVDGDEVHGEEAAALVEVAWAFFCNDTFWLNPVVKAFDDGVTRSIVERDGEQALLVSYSSGGVTPGDAYLWYLDADGTPRAWQMWVSVIPIGGVEATWEDWVTLDTGARIATRHVLAGVAESRMYDVEGASTLDALEPGDDPFAPLFE